MGSTTRIDKALRHSKNVMFTNQNGGRLEATKLLILLTDGSQTFSAKQEDPYIIADEIRNDGVSIIAIGIGEGINKTELSRIAGKDEYIYNADTFEELKKMDFLKRIKKFICGLVSSVLQSTPTIATTQASSTDGHVQPRCEAVVDVAFILDSSHSLEASYQKEKNFLKKLAAVFGISSNGSRVGVITFSYRAELSVKLNSFTDLSSFNEAVDKIPLMNFTTRIDRALRLAQKDMFTSANGGRVGVSKLIILLTDGSQTPGGDAEDPERIADELRDDGVVILGVGIGSAVNETELSHITGGKKNAYTAATFDSLTDNEFIHKIKNGSCEIVSSVLQSTPTIATTQASSTDGHVQPRCEAVVDVAFILDSSHSLEASYQKEKNFLKKLAAVFGISSNGSRVGVITFSYRAELSVKLNSFTDLSSFNEAVDKIPLMNFTTRIDRALRLAQKDMFTSANGGRVGVSKLIILLTDGSQTPGGDAEDPERIADELRDDGVVILGVGIGSAVNETELSHITGGKKNAYTAATFDSLTDNEFIHKIKNGSCEIVSSVLQSTPTIATTQASSTDGHVQPRCEAVVDVAFILDSSHSLEASYQKEKNFLKKLAAVFGISSNGSRVGVITFSYRAELSVKLNSFTDLSSFNEAVDKIPLMNFTTRIDRALRLAQKDMFTSANGGRVGVSKLIILLTDGSQTPGGDAEDPERIADELRDDGVVILGVGIGSAVNETELSHITGGKKNAYTAATFDSLTDNEFIHKIKNGSCEIVSSVLQSTPTIATTQASSTDGHVQPRCEAVVDVAFILDSSHSLEASYQKEKNFLKKLAAVFGISSNGSRVGVITFSYRAELSVKLNSFTDLSSFNEAVDKIPLMNFTTRIDRALRLAQKDMFTSANGGRVGVSKLIILLTDGSQTPGGDAEDPERIADELRDDGVVILGVGIGSAVNETELSHITGGKKNAYTAATFDSLTDNEFIHKIKNGSCEIVSSVLQSTPTIATTQASSTDGHVQPRCEAVVDVAFILDSSHSLEASYQKEKNFLKKLAAVFGISSNGSRVGVITFSYRAELSVKLNSFTDLSSFNEAVDKIPLMNFTTRIDRALRLAQKDMFTSANGGRVGVSKLIILLTDGSQTPGGDAEDPERIADELRDDGVVILGVGIGSAVNETELSHITGGKKNAYTAATFDSLTDNEFIHKIKNGSCEIVSSVLQSTPTIATTQASSTDGHVQPRCEAVVDVAFILDSSHSLEASYQKEKNFLKKLAAVFGISSNGSRVGVITFSYRAELSVKLNSFTDLSSFNEAVDKIPLMNFTTRIDRALRLAQKDMFTSANGGRVGVSKLIILLTDGSQTPGGDAEDPERIADELRDDGVVILGVGIGSAVNETELSHITGGKKNAYTAATFDSLTDNEFIHKIKNGSCEIVSSVLQSTPTIATTQASSTDGHVQPRCEAVVDVAFILDSSHSLEASYQKEKNFLKKLAAVFGISSNGSRVGVITFSYRAELSVKLNSFTDLSSFNEAVDKIPLMNFTTRIDRALRLAQKDMFTSANGGRVGVSKLIILLTDGSQTPGGDAEDPERIADELRDDGVVILGVGIGSAVNETELSHITGGKKNAYTAATFDSLTDNEFIHKIKNGSCEIVSSVLQSTPTIATTQASSTDGHVQPRCEAVVDVAFILDSSHSLEASYQKEKNFLKKLAAVFGISSNGSRVGVITFSYRAELSVKLNSFTDLSSFNEAVDKIPLMNFTTRIDRALRLAQKDMFTSANGGRVGVSKLIILLTDGSQTPGGDAEDPERIADELRDDGVVILGVGIGSAVNETELSHITGGKKNAYTAATFDSLTDNEFIHKIKNGSCEIVSSVLQSTPTIATTQASSTDGHVQPRCEAVVDVAFILDSSHSLEASYQKEKNFLKKLAAVFGISSNGSRVGVITFSYRAELSVKLNSFTDLSSFNEAVDKIPLMNFTTRIDRALRLAQKDMFTSANGGRVGVSKLIILLTDGSQTPGGDAEDPERIADELRDDGVVILGVGIGSAVNETELSHITGGKKNAYTAATFDSLTDNEFIHKIKNGSCEIVSSVLQSTPTIATTQASSTDGHVQPRCEAVVDVAFILDSSHSLEASYQKEKNFLKKLAAVFGISSNGSRVGVITFSYRAELSVKLNSFTDLSSFNEAVDKIPLMNFTTRIDRALRLAQKDMFTSANGGRVGVSKLIILLTDGSQTPGGDAEDPERIADELRDDGVVILGVGIGSAVNETELSHITGGKKNAYTAATFDSLTDNEFIHKIKNGSCEIVSSVLQSTPTIATTQASSTDGHVQPRCEAVVDVAFILDSSHSLEASYQKEKNFLKKLAAVFGISSNGSRVGVITFSYRAELSVKLNSFTDLSSFNEAVDKIPLMNFTTRIDRALRLAQKDMFTSANGGRVGVSKLIILLTDGSQTPGGDAEDPERIADELRDDGVVILGVGIGSAVNETELSHITGGKKNAYTAATFDSLTDNEFIHKIKNGSCEIVSSVLQSTPTIATTQASSTDGHVQPRCEAVVDVAFILDSSHSLEASYQKEKNFLKKLAAVFGISSNGSRVGVITFSYRAELSVKLNSFTDLSSFNEAVDKIPLMNFTTRIDRALRLAQKDMFTSANGGRVGVSKLIILLTDGSQTPGGDAEDPERIADELRDDGVVILGVGIGSAVNETELSHITGGKKNAYTAATFDSLTDNEFIHKIKNGSCEIVSSVLQSTPTIATTQASSTDGHVQPRCEAVVDVAFILDSSHSLEASYQKEKNFLKKLAAVFGISSNGSRVGVITFSYRAELSVKLNSFTDLSSFNEAVDKIPLMNFTTRIDRALRLAQKDMFTSANGGRVGVSKLIILLTDGSQTPGGDAEDPERIADELRDDGVVILGVGIGSAVNETELSHITGGKKNAYTAATFDSLTDNEFIHKIKNGSCEIVSSVLQSTPTIATTQASSTDGHVQPRCEAVVDVAFILDSSHSLEASYQKEKNFLKKLAAVFGISSNGSRVGVITFSYRAELSVKLNSFTDLSSFNEAVDKIPLMNFTTRIDRALRLAQKDMFTSANGGRVGVSKLIILLTDGSQTPGGDAEDPERIADELRDDGVVILGVGIGSAVNETELSHITGGKKNAYTAATFDSLTDNEFIHKIKNGSCEIVSSVLQSTPTIATTQASSTDGHVQPRCEAVVDVAFILDSSHSLEASYQKEKNFLKKLAAVFGISSNGSRVGVITFSYRAELSVKLNSFTDLSSFNEAVDKIPLMNFTTRIDRALRLAQKDMFTSANGGRVGVSKLIILLTDGSQTPGGDAEDPERIADELRDDGVVILGVGIGSAVNETELSHITGGKKNAYTAATFDSLTDNEFIHKIKNGSCEIVSSVLQSTPTIATTQASSTDGHVQPRCEAVVDVAFILDSSHSLEASYQKEKNFLKKLAAVFGISSNGSRVGVITFSYRAELSVKLNSFTDLSSFNEAVDKIPLMNFTTRIDRALRLAQKDMFTSANGGRVGVSKLIILLTDGSQTPGGDAEDPERIADELRDDGVVILGVGIGSAVNETELSHITGGKKNAYTAATFDSLTDNEFIHKIKNGSCEIVSSVLQSTPTIATTQASSTDGHVQPRCEAVVDVAFILDSSHSLEASYQKEKNFLKKLAAVFGISSNGSRVGVITFAIAPNSVSNSTVLLT
ncbi:uncharacterized protein LOC136080515 isoform X2 [Hydra vulgaris]